MYIDNRSLSERVAIATFFKPIPTTHTTAMSGEDSFLLKSWEDFSVDQMEKIVKETKDKKLKKIRIRVLNLKKALENVD
ncbi:hypothetical protein [Caulobacter phage Cr30]|uniref:hypothetical protein n=1 Tax=Caulobacter phage Cr30 TaxID=1357714 RepID=UPI0004A9B65F|nr:hypothetical protein OZ74_gp089 [Caulobacter phage Cr30]AGS80974.1 hypothetical protein [Caulobacter phage Cr30]